MTITVRAAEPEDWATIVDFNCRLALESEGKTLDRADVEPGVKRLLSDQRRGRYFVAVTRDDGPSPSAQATPPGPPLLRGGEDTDPGLGQEGEMIVGQLMHTFEWSDWRNGDIWWLQSVYVHPDFRRQGVFRALLEHLRSEAQADPGVVGLRLYVEQENKRAHATYEKLGFASGDYFVMQHMLRRQV